MPNRLAAETSPYLLQHKDNPVDWYPWGPEAFQRARDEDKPVLLSVGYSACHWCHVMAHESFENPRIAEVMNRLFINIKVDREERPDVDAIYMEAVQAMTGHGGWPMTVFLTPSGKPFYGGTYFPPQDSRGMPGFPRVLESIARTYHERRTEVEQSAKELSEYIAAGAALPPSREEPNAGVLDEAGRNLLRDFDTVHGGTVGAPKFPQPMNVEFLMKSWRRTRDGAFLQAAELTLKKMAAGGLRDQLGGGFHRYSVDDVWLVPHFEKMLYDNALLARAYLAAYQATADPVYREVAVTTLDYLAREMTSPEGGFYSAEDADSEGEEGKFYVWSQREVEEALGHDHARIFSVLYDVSEGGNFEGHNILHLSKTVEEVAALIGTPVEQVRAASEEGRRKLFAHRERRVRPGRDEKVLLAWNGLAIRAFAEAGAVLAEERYTALAEANVRFVTERMSYRVEDGSRRWYRTYKDGRAHVAAFAEDYAAYANGLISLYETTFDVAHLRMAREMVDLLIAHFWDEAHGGFFSTSDYHETLLARPKDLYDNALPSANSEAVEALLRLHLLTAHAEYERYAVEVMRPLLPALRKAPAGFGRMLSALDFYLAPSTAEVALVGVARASDTEEMLRAVWEVYAPNKVVAGYDPTTAPLDTGEVPLLEGRTMQGGKATAYICKNYICNAPTTDPADVRRELSGEMPALDGIDV